MINPYLQGWLNDFKIDIIGNFENKNLAIAYNFIDEENMYTYDPFTYKVILKGYYSLYIEQEKIILKIFNDSQEFLAEARLITKHEMKLKMEDGVELDFRGLNL